MRSAARISAWTLGILMLLVISAGVVVVVGGNTDAGRGVIERLTSRLTAGTVQLKGLGGAFPTRLTLGQLELVDHTGVWLRADHIALQWSPLALLDHRIRVHTLNVARLQFERTPVSDGKSSGGTVSFPTIDLGAVSIDALELGAPLVGTPARLSVQGRLLLHTLDDAVANVAARRLDGDGQYDLTLRMDRKRIDATLALHEPAGGPLESLLTMPGLGALTANVSVRGARDDEAVELALDAGELQARVNGRIDLTHQAADLDYSVKAAAMAPRPDVSWSAIALDGNWHGPVASANASGRLQIDRLRVAGGGGAARLNANLIAHAGKLDMRAEIRELTIPGPEPRFFANDPLTVDASWQLDAPLRPLLLTVGHPLLSLRGHGQTVAGPAGDLAAALEMRIPELAAYTVFTGQDVHGSALINAQLTHHPKEDAMALDASLGLTGGEAPWVARAGPHVTLQASGSLSDARLKVDNLKLAAHAMTLAASGTAERATPAPAPNGGKADNRDFLTRFARQLQARYQLDVSDLNALSDDLAGNLKMSGTFGGSPGALKADADLLSDLSVRGSPRGALKASLRVRGLPATPNGTLQASGMLDGAPLTLDAAFDRSAASALHLAIRQADWKSAHIDGDVKADAALAQGRGQINLRIAQLGDLDRLTGMSLSGSVEGGVKFVPVHGQTGAELRLDGRDLVVGQMAGSVTLSGNGVLDAFGLQLSARLPDLHGLPADLATTADLNLTARSLKLATASVTYHGQTAKLLAPAVLSFDKGMAVDDLKIGVQDAIVEVRGAVSPALDMRASVAMVKPELINVFVPGLLAGGVIEGRAHLQGTTASPTGRMRLDASGIRFADDAATGLPPLGMHARAELNGDTANVTAKLDAGAASQVTATGTVPLKADGALDLKINGKLDVGLANPFLEARGMRATGALSADATVTGSTANPQVGGAITLAQGSLRDYARGLNLTDITADIGGGEGALQIKSFNAKAASGTLAMTGTVGVLQPGLPVDLKITAKDAQPIASNILTANLDADVHVSGTARQRLDVAGTIHVNRAIIGIPDSLPPDVAVLDVRRRGAAAQTTPDQQLVIGINIAIQAPQQILVQGRGLDAEMGGEIHLNGTSDAPQASGHLDLQRGSFTISGNKLTFSSESKISFDGEGLGKKIDPTLDFLAQTTVGDTTVKLAITGFADAPRFEFSSVPQGMPQDSIMALLLFGQPAAQLSALQIAQVGYALATLSGVGGGGGSNPLVKLQKTLGLDRLTVGTNQVATATGGTENSGAAIAAGRYVSKRVYIEGKQTTTGTSQVQVDIDLTKRLKLQTRLGNGTATVQGTTPDNDPGSSIGLLYQFEY